MFEAWTRVKHKFFWIWTIYENEWDWKWLITLFEKWLKRVSEEMCEQYRKEESFYKKENRDSRIEEHKKEFVIVGLEKKENEKRKVAYTARPFNS